MKKINNKGFAASVVLYAAVTLVALILFLILSVLSTSLNNKNLIVDDIKKEVSGSENTKAESLGNVTIIASDNKGSGEWHTTGITLNFSMPTSVSSPVTYYYGTSTDDITNIVSGDKISISTDTTGITYYIKACRDSNMEVCGTPSAYLVKIDKELPTITVDGTSTTWETSRTLTITPTALSGISYYQYFVTDSTSIPLDTDEINTTSSNTLKITEQGQYIFIRAINNANNKGTWEYYDLYVGTENQ